MEAHNELVIILLQFFFLPLVVIAVLSWQASLENFGAPATLH